MAYPDDDTTPYWASTVPVLGLDDGRPKGPLDLPLEFLLSGQFARALSEASNPRIPADLMPFPRVPSHMLPPASPMGDWSSNPSLPTPANVSAGFASPPARLPPSFAPAPPVEHLDAGKYWGSSSALPEAPAPSSAHGFYHSPIPQGPSWDSVSQPADSAAQSFLAAAEPAILGHSRAADRISRLGQILGRSAGTIGGERAAADWALGDGKLGTPGRPTRADAG